MATTRKTAKRSQKVSVDDTIVNGVMSVMDNHEEWTGTMTDLMSTLDETLNQGTTLPGSPSALRVVLNRVVNRLRCRGVSVRFGRTKDHARTRYVRFATR